MILFIVLKRGQQWRSFDNERDAANFILEYNQPGFTAVKKEFIEKKFVDELYTERAHLTALLSTLYPSSIEDNPMDDPGFSKILYIELPTGQISYHIADSDLHLYKHLKSKHWFWKEQNKQQELSRIRELLK